jgi:hypothetical protein
MRLRRLLLTSCVTVLAFALFGANAKVAMAWDNAPAPEPTCTEAGTVDLGVVSGSAGFCVHINEPRTVGFDPTLCQSSTVDADMNASQPPEARTQQCGHAVFRTTVASTVAASFSYPEAPMNIFTVGICQLDPTGTFCQTVFTQDSPNCTFSQSGTGMVTVSLTCTGLPAGSYEVLVTPTFFDSCADVFALLAPGCPSVAGIGITGTVTVTPQNAGGAGGGGGGNSNSSNKMTGGGDVTTTDGAANFAILGFEGQVKGHLRLSVKSRCSVKVDSVTTVFLAPNRARLRGNGLVKSASGQWNETVEAYAEDNGEGKSQPQPDRIQFTSTHCNVTLTAVVKGNIQAHFYG